MTNPPDTFLERKKKEFEKLEPYSIEGEWDSPDDCPIAFVYKQKELWDFIESALKEAGKDERKIERKYRYWAKSHQPTWETDNLVHDLMGNPKKPVVLAKLK